MIKLIQLVFEFTLGAFAVLFVVRQVFIPLFRGTPVFPWFRKRRGRGANDHHSAH